MSFQVGAWHVDIASRSVSNGELVKRVSPRAARLLEVLASAGGEAVSRHELLEQVWPGVFVGDDSLTQVVTELRRIFDDRRSHSQTGASRMIETIPKYGYRLNASVVFASGGEADFKSLTGDTFDLEAYHLCLDARTAMSRSGREGFLEPERLARAAVLKAPGFALGHAEYSIALCYRWLYQRGNDNGLIKALEHAEIALKLRPDMGICHAAMAFAQGALGNGDRVRASLSEGLARDPGDSELHYLGARSMLAMQDFKCAASLAERSAFLNPDDLRPLYLAARVSMNFDPARSRRNAQACLTRVRAHLEIDPTEARALNTLGPLYAILGDEERCLRALGAQVGYRTPLQFYDVVALSQLGRVEAASEAFERVVDLGWRHGDWLRAEPSLMAMSENPRFKKVARSIGVG